MMTATQRDLVAGLPGAELVLAGLRDLEQSGESIAALLVATAAQRIQQSLGDLGLPALPGQPERRLYALCCRVHGPEAYSQYNAHLRRLSRFCRALESRGGRTS